MLKSVYKLYITYTEIIFSTSSGLTVDQLTSIVRGLTHTLPAAPANPNPNDTQEEQPPEQLDGRDEAALRLLQEYSGQVGGKSLDPAALEAVIIRCRSSRLSRWFAGALLLMCGGELPLWERLVHSCRAGTTGGPVRLLAELASGPAGLRAGEFVEWILSEELPQELWEPARIFSITTNPPSLLRPLKHINILSKKAPPPSRPSILGRVSIYGAVGRYRRHLALSLYLSPIGFSPLPITLFITASQHTYHSVVPGRVYSFPLSIKRYCPAIRIEGRD